MGLYVGKMDEKLGNMEIVEILRKTLGKELEIGRDQEIKYVSWIY